MISPSTVLRRLAFVLGPLVALLHAPNAWAQGGGFGPDPYRPYNQQYDPFVYPSAPGTGNVVPNEAAMNRGMRSNQFQEYLRSAGVGDQSYRSRRQMDPKSYDLYQYQPNRKVDQESGFYEKQDAVSEAYFAYLRERDPKKRAQLLKEYQRIQRRPSRSFSTTNVKRRGTEKAEEEEPAATSGRRSNLPPAPRGRTSGSTLSRVAPPPRSQSRDAASPPQGEAAPARPAGSTRRGSSSDVKPSDILDESLRREKELKPLFPGSVGRTAPLTPRPSGAIPPAPR